MSDKRPFAKIDTGYIMNPKWFKVRRAMRIAMPTALHSALHSALRTAMQAHLASILYCAQNQTDGIFPVDAIKSLCLIQNDEEEAAITALFEVGLWINHTGGMAEVRDYLEHQTSAESINAASEAGKKAAQARWSKNADRNAFRNADRITDRNANRNAEEKRKEEKRKDIYNAHFARFWDTFPNERKRDKQKCATLFSKAVKTGTDPELIISAAGRYLEDPNREPEFTVNPVTWLREQRWDSGPLPAKTNNADRSLQALQRDRQRLQATGTQPTLQIASEPYPWEQT